VNSLPLLLYKLESHYYLFVFFFPYQRPQFPSFYGMLLTVKTCWLQVECAVRGKLDPACNAIAYIDRKILGINHLYQHPAWKRSEVHANFFSNAHHLLLWNHGKNFVKLLQACTEASLYEAPFQTSAPTWCKAPFEPDGILRFVVHNLYQCNLILEFDSNQYWAALPFS